MKKLKAFWEDLNKNIVVRKRELVLGVALGAVSGMVLGMLCSPRKNVTIGSHNWGNGCNNSPQPLDEEMEEPKDEPEA